MSRVSEDSSVNQILKIFWQRRWRIAALISVVVVVALATSLTQDPLYMSEAKVLLEEIPDVGLNPETEAEIAQSSTVIEDASDLAGSQIMGNDFLVRPLPGTEILVFSYEAKSPADAEKGASALVDSYLENRRARVLDSVNAARLEIQNQIDAGQARLDQLARVARREGPSQQISRERTELLVRLGVLEQDLADLKPIRLEKVGPGEVIAPAERPRSRTSPNLRRNLALALALALPLAIALVLIADRKRLQTPGT